MPIPSHLHPFIANQSYERYTPIDHASWRFILRISASFFEEHAHAKYREGLAETGISVERIPRIEEMDEKLQRFGWRAVAVSGFIPPAAFMEFQSLGILPIAAEMRTLEHLAYTPAPDIVHEAAGHAPIIADPEYAAYLRAYGEVARKAIFSSKDMELYEAIRDLSDIKEDPASTADQIHGAQRRLDEVISSIQYVSEATYLARMNWWTVEYGLVGDLAAPKIYGAGLLSSVGESYHCLSQAVRKIPLTLDCVNNSYDITRPQPQLYVAANFEALTNLLHEVAATMAFRRGGLEGLAKAKMAGTVTTSVLSSGVQVSGVLADFRMNAAGAPIYLSFKGPSQLGFCDSELEGHGPSGHRDGFGTAVGLLDDSTRPEHLTLTALEKRGFSGVRAGLLRFTSGVEVRGVLRNELRRNGALLVLSFEDCTVSLGGEILFRPEWGTYDLACGTSVDSVFGGAADRQKYLAATGGYGKQPRKMMKSNLTPENRALNELYAEVRHLRETRKAAAELLTRLTAIESELERGHQQDWLLRWELLELCQKHSLQAPWESRVNERLDEISALSADRRELIARGRKVLT